MSTHVHRQQVYDKKTGKLVFTLEHHDTPAPRTQQQRTRRTTQQPPAPAKPLVVHESQRRLTCAGCGRITGCTCGTPTPGGLDAIVAMQKAQGKRV